MDDAAGGMLGILPVMFVGGLALHMSDKLFPGQPNRAGMSEISRKQAVSRFGKQRTVLASKQPGMVFNSGRGESLVYNAGKYYATGTD